MADIELVIKIPEGLKKDFELEQWTALSCMEMKDALMNGTLLPKGHGKLIDADEVINPVMSAKDWYSGGDQHYWEGAKAVLDMIELAKPIIKAEEAEDGHDN